MIASTGDRFSYSYEIPFEGIEAEAIARHPHFIKAPTEQIPDEDEPLALPAQQRVKGGKASFRYENHSQIGVFQMHSLAWVAFADSGSSDRTVGEYDTVTFSCFGTWSKDGVSVLRQASVQISTSPAAPYVAIQIDSGAVSNVNTKPPDIQSVLP